MSKHQTRALLCTVLSFVLFLLMLAFAAMAFIETTVMNESYMDRVMTQSSYASQLTKDLQNTLTGWGAVSAVDDPAVFTGVVNESRVMNDSRRFVEGVYNGQINQDIRADAQKSLRTALEAYVQTQDTSDISQAELEENITALTDLCTDEYVSQVMISGMYGMCQTFRGIRMYMNLAMGLFAILAGVVIWMFWRMKHRSTSVLRYIIYSLTAMTMALWGAYAFMEASQIMTRVAISQTAMYQLLNDATRTLMGTWLGMTLVMTLVLVVLLAVYFSLSFGRRAHKKNSRHSASADKTMLIGPEDL